jgi:hypothetical protein
MSRRRPYIGPSDAQANADALARRGAPYTAASGQSFAVAWDWRKRQPKNLREAVDMCRSVYASEVPTKLHDGPDAIGLDGTPRMSARAEGYIFGDPRSDDAGRDAESGQRDLIGNYHAPFRARLAEMSAGSELDRKRAAIVSHVTIGSQGPVEAAVAEGVPSWAAGIIARDALFAFLHSMSDIRLHLPVPNDPVADGVTAA